MPPPDDEIDRRERASLWDEFLSSSAAYLEGLSANYAGYGADARRYPLAHGAGQATLGVAAGLGTALATPAAWPAWAAIGVQGAAGAGVGALSARGRGAGLDETVSEGAQGAVAGAFGEALGRGVGALTRQSGRAPVPRASAPPEPSAEAWMDEASGWADAQDRWSEAWTDDLAETPPGGWSRLRSLWQDEPDPDFAARRAADELSRWSETPPGGWANNARRWDPHNDQLSDAISDPDVVGRVQRAADNDQLAADPGMLRAVRRLDPADNDPLPPPRAPAAPSFAPPLARAAGQGAGHALAAHDDGALSPAERAWLLEALDYEARQRRTRED